MEQFQVGCAIKTKVTNLLQTPFVALDIGVLQGISSPHRLFSAFLF